MSFLFVVMATTFLVSTPKVESATTVWKESESVPYVVDYPTNYTYVTIYGNYSFSKVDGSYQYIHKSGEILASSVRFIIQFLDVYGSWEDLTLTDISFPIVENTKLIFALNVKNGTVTVGNVEVTAEFWKNKTPKLSCLFTKNEYWQNADFRILFKVTVPQAWEYFYDHEKHEVSCFKNVEIEIVRKKVFVINTSTLPYKLALLVDWEDFGTTKAILKGSTITVTFPVNIAQIDPTTIGTSTASTATWLSFQRKTFYANSRFWVFYFNGTHIVYRTSTDGETWTSETVIRVASYGYQFSVWFDGTYLHYAFAEILGGANRGGALYYRRGTPNSDGSITWSASEQTVMGSRTDIDYQEAFVAVDSAGCPWIGYSRIYGLTNDQWVTKSATNDGTWVNATGFPTQLTITTGNWRTCVIPLTLNKTYVIYAD